MNETQPTKERLELVRSVTDYMEPHWCESENPSNCYCQSTRHTKEYFAAQQYKNKKTSRLINSICAMNDLDPRFTKIVDKHFWELI